MTDPITPPPELLQLWFEQHYAYNKGLNELLIEVARYGADQELEACCEYVYERLKLTTVACFAEELRAARRPKPPSLKEQALDALERYTSGKTVLIDTCIDTIRRALEALPDD